MVLVSKSIASKVTSRNDQILWSRIVAIVCWDMLWAKKVTSGSLLPLSIVISSMAFLRRPIRVGCFSL